MEKTNLGSFLPKKKSSVTAEEKNLIPDFFSGKIPDKIKKLEHPGFMGGGLAWLCNIHKSDLLIAMQGEEKARLLSNNHDMVVTVAKQRSLKVCNYAYDTDGNLIPDLCSVFIPNVAMDKIKAISKIDAFAA